jgi:hypothetical protein
VFPKVVLPAVRNRENLFRDFFSELAAAFVFCLRSLPVVRQLAEVDRLSVDWIFVLDTSASMYGAGGNAPHNPRLCWT